MASKKKEPEDTVDSDELDDGVDDPDVPIPEEIKTEKKSACQFESFLKKIPKAKKTTAPKTRGGPMVNILLSFKEGKTPEEFVKGDHMKGFSYDKRIIKRPGLDYLCVAAEPETIKTQFGVEISQDSNGLWAFASEIAELPGVWGEAVQSFQIEQPTQDALPPNDNVT